MPLSGGAGEQEFTKTKFRALHVISAGRGKGSGDLRNVDVVGIGGLVALDDAGPVALEAFPQRGAAPANEPAAALTLGAFDLFEGLNGGIKIDLVAFHVDVEHGGEVGVRRQF